MSTVTRDRSFRPAVLEAARTSRGIKCAGCGGYFKDKEIEADHIRPRGADGPDDPSNGQALCKAKCHKKKTAREAKRRARDPLIRQWLRSGGLLLGAGLPAVDHVARAFDASGVRIRSLLDLAQLPHVQIDTMALAVDCAYGGALGLALGVAVPHLPRALRWLTIGHTRPAATAPKAVEAPKSSPGSRIAEAVDQLLPTGKTVTVSERKDGAWSVSYKGTGLRAHKEDVRIEVIDAISAATGKRWIDTWRTEEDQLLVQPRPALPARVDHPGLPADRPWHVLPFGASAHGVASFDLKKTSHLLICGLTNSGKTSVLRTFLVPLLDDARKGIVEVILCDPKRVSLRDYRTAQGVRMVATSTEALWDAAILFAEEMEKRYRWADVGDERGVIHSLDSHKPWVLFIDEYEEYIEVMTEHANEQVEQVDAEGNVLMRSGQPVMGPREKITQKYPASPIRAVARAARLAREAGMHLIIGTQRGDADLIGGRVRNNFGGRLLVGRAGASESLMCFGSAAYGRDIPAIQGRCTAQTGEAKPYEVQCWWVPKPTNPDLPPTALTKESS